MAETISNNNVTQIIGGVFTRRDQADKALQAFRELGIPESNLQVVVQLTRLADGTRKVTAISEITGMEQDAVTMQDIFVFEKLGLTEEGRVKGSFRATGIRPKCAQMIAASGIQLPRQMFEHLQVVA